MKFEKKKIDTNLFVGEKNKHLTKFSLPSKFEFCKNCLATNQKPTTRSEHSIKKDETKPLVFFDGICEACIVEKKKNNHTGLD